MAIPVQLHRILRVISTHSQPKEDIMKIQFGCCLVIVLVAVSNTLARPLGDGTDHLFPRSGNSMVTLSTGIPYVGISEYAYGFSDRFSIGLVGGVTPRVETYGIRVRAILHRKDAFRIYFRAPVLYYPKTRDLGGEPWVLTWPVVVGEWLLGSGTRLSAGVGAIAAACYNSLIHELGFHRAHAHFDEEEGFMGGVWNTVHVGAAIPLSKQIMFQTELAAVMKGLNIAGRDWVGGPPIILVLGFSYTF